MKPSKSLIISGSIIALVPLTTSVVSCSAANETEYGSIVLEFQEGNNQATNHQAFLDKINEIIDKHSDPNKGDWWAPYKYKYEVLNGEVSVGIENNNENNETKKVGSTWEYVIGDKTVLKIKQAVGGPAKVKLTFVDLYNCKSKPDIK